MKIEQESDVTINGQRIQIRTRDDGITTVLVDGKHPDKQWLDEHLKNGVLRIAGITIGQVQHDA